MLQTKQQIIDKLHKELEEQAKNNKPDPYRLAYHLMPPMGLLNDPNGFIQFNGVYHLFFQWNPFATEHGSKCWGHYTSGDFVHWKPEAVALTPSDWFDRNGCYSGSAIEKDGKLIVFYTGNVKNEQGERETYQCMAVSEDGVHFEKKGPVLSLPPGYTAHFRDPKVWQHNGRWYMIIGAQSSDETGKAVLFTSTDLESWEHLGAVAGAHVNQLGDFGYMWECPDLFPLGDKDVFIVSPQGIAPDGYLYNNLYQSGYFIGKLDYINAAFTHGDFTELDRGFDFYAPQTTMDDKGRRLLFAWMGLPEENEDSHPTRENGWIHAMTLPRCLELRGDKLFQKPAEELQQLRKKKVEHKNVILDTCPQKLDGIRGTAAELLIILNEEVGPDTTFTVSIREEAEITFDSTLKRLTLSRLRFAAKTKEYRHCRLAHLNSLQIFIDTSSIEIFVNDGEEVFTARIFPDPGNDTITFAANSRLSFNVTKWDMSFVLPGN